MRVPVRLKSIAILMLMLLASVALFWGSTPTAAAAGDPLSLARSAADLGNQERLKAGLNPLAWNDQLAAAATKYAGQMAAASFFAHNGPDGSTPVSRAQAAGYPAYGWGGLYVGENLARGFNTAESVDQAWMNSAEHRANLLLPKYREIGIGVAVAPDGTKYWAQEFGSRPKVLPVLIDNGAPTTDTPKVSLTLTDEEVSSWGSLGVLSSMMVSNRPDFAGAYWEPFTKTRNWLLQGQPGPQSVFVRLKDANGQMVESTAAIDFEGRQALGTLDLPVSATIQTVFPKDGLPVAQAPTVNVTARLAVRDSNAPLPVDFSRPVLLLSSLNGGPELVAGHGVRRVDDPSLWDFDGVDVSKVADAANSYRFRVTVDGTDTQSTTWDHHQTPNP